uniref:Protein kinase domain-containing protein n=1 Tax=Oryza glumipatula TaxID=40148 RepID=A0A0E0BT09_9ORYZ
MWDVVEKAAAVVELIGGEVGGLISMIMKGAVTAHRNKEECEQLAKYVFTIAQLLPHLVDQEVMQRLEEEVQLYGDDAEVFTMEVLKAATNDFAADRRMSERDFGTRLYMGRLSDGREVVIKLLGCYHSFDEFEAERKIHSQFRHRHIRRLVGYCVQRQKCKYPRSYVERGGEPTRLLVFEYMKNGSLHDHLHGSLSSSSPVTKSWEKRIKILLGVSRAIEYLHTHSAQPVIHCDVKPSNILLDVNYAPLLSDFGVSITLGEEPTEVWGTSGYVDPEYLMTQTVKPWSDVYSFGVVMLEVLTGRKTFFLPTEREPNSCQEVVDDLSNLQNQRHGRNWVKKSCSCLSAIFCKSTSSVASPESPPTSPGDGDGPAGREEEEDEISRIRRKYIWAPPTLSLIVAGKLQEVLDMRPTPTPTPRQLQAVYLLACTAAHCLEFQGRDRPDISKVVIMLEEALELVHYDEPIAMGILLYDIVLAYSDGLHVNAITYKHIVTTHT